MKHLSHFLRQLENLPVNVPELKQTLANAITLAKKESSTIVVSWCGHFDLVVHPIGTFQIVPISSFKIYKISDESDNHCVEVVL